MLCHISSLHSTVFLKKFAKLINTKTQLILSYWGVGGADKKWKGNFWFCFAASDYEMNICIISFVALWNCSFLRPCGETRRFLSAFGGSSGLRGFVHWSW